MLKKVVGLLNSLEAIDKEKPAPSPSENGLESTDSTVPVDSTSVVGADLSDTNIGQDSKNCQGGGDYISCHGKLGLQPPSRQETPYSATPHPWVVDRFLLSCHSPMAGQNFKKIGRRGKLARQK